MGQTIQTVLKTRTLDQLPPTVSASTQALLPIQEPEGPLQSIKMSDFIAQLPQGPAYRATVAALKSAPPSTLANLYDGSLWQIVWRSSQAANVQAAIAADVVNGVFAISTVDPDYAWVRQLDSRPLARWWGAKPDDNSVNNGVILNIAINVCALAGYGPVFADRPGVYWVEATGNHFAYAAHRQSLYIQHDNAGLILLQGSKLKLKAGQQTNAGGAVEVVAFSNIRKDLYFRYVLIDGNTAGQTGWTLGYEQTSHGNGFSGFGGGNGKNWVFEDCGGEDLFSNPMVLGNSLNGVGALPTGNEQWIDGVRVTRFLTKNTGEGASGLYIKNLIVEDCFTLNDDGIDKPGDGMEWVNCDGAVITNNVWVCKGSGGYNSTIDLGGTSDFQVTGIKAKGVKTGLDLTYSRGVAATGAISDCHWTGMKAGGIAIVPSQNGKVTYSNCSLKDSPGASLYRDPHAPAIATTANATASIAGTTMTVTALASGAVTVGHMLRGTNILQATVVVAQISGAMGGTGTYSVSRSQTSASAPVSIFNPSGNDVAQYPMDMTNCGSENTDGIAFNSSRPIKWRVGGVKGATNGIGIMVDASDAVRDITVDLSDLTLEGNYNRDFEKTGGNLATLRGRMSNIRMASPTPYSPMNNLNFEELEMDRVGPDGYRENGTPYMFGVQTFYRQNPVTTLGMGSKGQTVLLRADAGGGATVAVTHSATLRLKGAPALPLEVPTGSGTMTFRYFNENYGGTVSGYWAEIGRNF